MNIAIDCRMSGKSGIGTFLDNILPYFLQTKNSFIFIVNENYNTEYLSFNNVNLIKCNIKTFSLKEILFFPKKILASINKCDLYFTPYINIPSGIKIPIYSTIHDIVFLDMPKIAGKIGTLIRKYFYKRAINKSKSIFTVSEFSKKRIIKKLHCKKQVTVVYNGVSPLIEKVFNEKNKITKEKTIVFVGNIKAHKGLLTLIRAFNLLSKDLSQDNYRLLIIGNKNNFRTEDKETTKLLENSETKGIEFTGFINNTELITILQKASLLVQPSLYEGFGIPPLEALYCGTKVVLSDIEVFKEIYSFLPVNFFKKGDSVDLYNVMKKVLLESKVNPPVPFIYSYKRTSEILLNTLQIL